MKKAALVLLMFSGIISFSQQVVVEEGNQEVSEQALPKKAKKQNKGKMYFYWGWNRGFYMNSDITFKGDDYNFVLKDVKANDRQDEINADYVNPGRITIPQTNFRLGYFFHDNWDVSFGIDHMKYVMNNNQDVPIHGVIDNGSMYDGVYTGEKINLSDDFLQFEHTDGLNYLNIELNRFDRLNDIFNFDTGFVDFNLTEGIGAGLLFPKTNAKLMDYARHDEFHVAGFGVSAKAGLNITFFDHFFVQSECKVGYISMPDIRTTANTSDSASQDFGFLQGNVTFGFRFQLVKQKDKAVN